MKKAKENLARLWDKTNEGSPEFDRAAQVRTLVALMALCSMLLPWTRLDGYTNPMTGADLIAFAFTSPERGAMFRLMPLGALALLFIPLVTTITAIYVFAKSVEGEHPVMANIMAITLPVVMLYLAQTLTGSDQPQLFWITIPKLGIITLILCNTALIGLTIIIGSQARRVE